MQRTILLLICSLIFISSGPTSGKIDKIYKANALLEFPDLVSELFKDKDVVFIGENHRIKQHVGFISEVIPILQKKGIHILFSEFANYSDTKLADSICLAPAYNEKLVYQILHRSEWDWAYQEYADIYHAAWSVNHNLKKGEQPFRIIGLQPDLNYSAIQAPADWDNPDKIREYWNYKNNKTWLEIIESEAIGKNQKALVHCGYHHAFSKFHHPIVMDGKFVRYETDREGTSVYNKYPQKVVTAILYNSLPQRPDLEKIFIKPFSGAIDSVILSLPEGHNHFGFISAKSRLGNLIDTSSFYSMGYGRISLKDFCDAVIVVGPVCDYESATLIDNFINDGNLENSKIQAFPYSFTREGTVQSFNDSINLWHQDNLRYIEKIKKSCSLHTGRE
ncbi:MAG: hypothetical protein NTU98_02830 [Bacteroidetes bacterium]|nr:hypothetical protein [Bacteroidota bacterium]